MYRFKIALLALLGLSLSVHAQEDFRVWMLTGANLRINSKWELRVNELYGFDPEPRDEETGEKDPPLSFIQHGIHARYRLHRTINLHGGVDILMSNSGRSDRNIGHRLTAAAQQSFDLDAVILRHSLRYEWFTPERSRYRHRVLYTVRGEYPLDKAPWNLRPYTSLEVGYYGGGQEISYYTPDAEFLDSSAPSGLHRFRATVGLAARPHRMLNVSAFYMMQREFNMGSDPVGHLNYFDPAAERTRFRFNQYSVLGVSAKLRLRLESGRTSRSRSPEQRPELLIPDGVAE
jgi:hypothetical protein